MDLFNLNWPQFESFLFVFTRVAALITFAPILGSAQLPRILKVGFIFSISLVVFPLIPSQASPHPRGLFELMAYLFSEVTVGLAIGYAARLLFTAVQVAGTIVDFQMGFGVVNVIDPQTETQVSVTAQFQNIFAILLFLTLDGHHFLVHAVLESFYLINPATFDIARFAPEYILQLFAATFTVAIKFAAPIMAILFFISVGLGLVARTVPQMNVFIVGFPLQIGVGLLMVGLSMSFFSILFKNMVGDLPGQLAGLLYTL